MEPIVIERPSSEEVVNNQSQKWNHGIVDSSFALTQHNLSGSSNLDNQTGCRRTNTTNDSLGPVSRFIMPGYEWCAKLHQEILTKSKNCVRDSCNVEIAGSDPTSTCEKTFVSPMNADVSVLHKDSNSSRSISLTHEKDEKSVEVKQVVELPCKKRRKKFAVSTNGSLDSATAVPDKKTEAACAKEDNLCLEKTLLQEIPTKSENLVRDSCNVEVAGSYPASTSGQSCGSQVDANVSVIHGVTNSLSSRSISLNHEGSEKSVEAAKSPGKKKRKRWSKDTSKSLDSGTDEKTEGGCGNEATINLEKKLLVLDLNGILVDIVPSHGGRTIGGEFAKLAGKAVFKRRFCEDFLDFCFKQFNVGVWSSRKRKNIDKLVDLLFGEKKKKLLFCWDDTYCTETGVKTLQNNAKPLVLKELKVLWEKDRPEVPWDKGHFNETNTVLLDDSPYKALRNPPYTAIFPSPFSYRTEDNSLGQDGELRNYLMRLARADNVQKFIQENPFGQIPIAESDVHWRFYEKIITPKPLTAPKKNCNNWRIIRNITIQ